MYAEHNPLHKLYQHPTKQVVVKKDQLDDFLDENTLNGEHRLFANCELYDIIYERMLKPGHYKVSLKPA